MCPGRGQTSIDSGWGSFGWMGGWENGGFWVALVALRIFGGKGKPKDVVHRFTLVDGVCSTLVRFSYINVSMLELLLGGMRRVYMYLSTEQELYNMMALYTAFPTKSLMTTSLTRHVSPIRPSTIHHSPNLSPHTEHYSDPDNTLPPRSHKHKLSYMP